MNDLTIREKTTEQLKKELAQGLTIIASNVMHLGKVWRELEERGENLDDLRDTIPFWLPLIASGRLLAEAVVMFANRPAVLKALDGVPLYQQEEYINGSNIDVYTPKATVSLPLKRIPSSTINHIFKDGRLLSCDEQRVSIARTAKRHKPGRKYKVRVDKKERTITVGMSTVPVIAVISALAEAAGSGEVVESNDRPAKVVGAKFNDDEKERIKAAAIAYGISESELMRKAVLSMLLI